MKTRLLLLLPVLLASACARQSEPVPNPKPTPLSGQPVGYRPDEQQHPAPAAEEATPPELHQPAAEEVERAVAVLMPIGDSKVSGVVYFVRENDNVHLRGSISGLPPNSTHGFHVHQYGDLTDNKEGLSAGGHFDPTHQPHGAEDDPQRHVGDLGNITTDEHGVAHIDKQDPVIKLNGAHSIVGRSLVVHAQADRFVQPTGDAGGRVGVGVIGITKAQEAKQPH